ncbi:MAG TPA: NAD(P)-dependent alcohol dehydrogenase [Ktedonobacterales bacterium]|nr:NAD(P)-dependent alcohol dehydrogenase [Ktedonobacterales bacterium]
MKAIIRERYGPPDVLRLAEVPQPLPKAGEVLVRVRAASVNAVDWHLMRGAPLLARMGGRGLRQPKDPRLGVDLAGTVEAVGPGVTRFQPGDDVLGRGLGTFAERACAREDAIVAKPPALSFAAAAAVPQAALIALQALRDKGRLRAGQQVVIQGASGGVGSFAVQIARALGAEVTAVCSPPNLETAHSIGADHVIDYTQADFTRNGQRYDLIVAVNGYHPLFAYRRALRPGGAYVLVGASTARLARALLQLALLGPVLSRMGGRTMGLLVAKPPQRQDLELINAWLADGKVVPVVERNYPLSDAAAAIGYVEGGHARGKIVITI